MNYSVTLNFLVVDFKTVTQGFERPVQGANEKITGTIRYHVGLQICQVLLMIMIVKLSL
jgi:hypothetical protein